MDLGFNGDIIMKFDFSEKAILTHIENNYFHNNPIKIFPNPTANSIQISGLINAAKIDVFSSEGRKLLTTTVSAEGKLDLNMASGIYFIKINTENKSVVKKLLVK